MEPKPTSSTAKVIATIALVGLGLSGLAMSLCGGLFTGYSLIELIGSSTASSEAQEWGKAFLIIGAPSLVFGLLIMVLTVVAWKRVRG